MNVLKRIIDLHFDYNLTPKIAEIYGMLIETRTKLFKEVEGITQEQLDYSPNILKFETIGTLLFHIEAIEFSWFYEDIFKEEMNDEDWKYAFALRKTLDPPQLIGRPLSFYLKRLEELRKRIFETLQSMVDEDLYSVVDSGGRKFTIYWILHHIHQHEALHIGQINFLKRLYLTEHGNNNNNDE